MAAKKTAKRATAKKTPAKKTAAKRATAATNEAPANATQDGIAIGGDITDTTVRANLDGARVFQR